MLVLTRKAGERVVIDGGITITVLSARNGRLRIGVEAPHDVMVLRGELLGKEAARPAGDEVWVPPVRAGTVPAR
jgi:carbon storage regulator